MRADRLVSLLLLLQTRGRMTARELAETLEVSERTIYRDLDALNAAGIPVYAERGPGGGCALPEGYRTMLTGMTEAEVQALFASAVPRLLADLGFGEVLELALLKLMAALPTPYQHDAERMRQRIYLDPLGWFQDTDPAPHLQLLLQAVWEDRRVQLVYRKANGEIVERLVDPYGLVAKARIWYLIGGVEGELRIFRVSRVQAAVLTEESSERPAGFDLKGYWTETSSWFETTRPYYPVTFRIAPEGLPSLRTMLGENYYELIEQAGPPDAAGWTPLSMTFGSAQQACVWLLSFGSTVEILEPQELRAQMIDLAQNTLDVYR